MQNYLAETAMLDYSTPEIQKLIADKKWMESDPIERVKSIYHYVRDEILFGYNISDEIPASEVLADGYGQCNTKSTLLMALLRATGIPCRLHGFTIHKALQKGAISGIWYRLSPDNIVHTWTEVYINGEWYALEGVILDKMYLSQLQKANRNCQSTFCGYGTYTDQFQNPPIDWNLNHTYIQSKGINQDFGLFDSPDAFFSQHKQKLNMIKRFLFEHLVRKLMNRNVDAIRKGIK